MGPYAFRFLFRPFCVAVMVGAILGASVLAAPPPPECALPIGAFTEVPSNVRVADPDLRSELAELAASSQVVRDMLEAIGSSPRALVAVRASSDVLRGERLDGLSTAGLSDGVLVVQVWVGDSERSAAHRQVVLAHELAHVVEFVSLPRLPARQLANILMSRDGHHTPWSSSMRIETAFAHAVEQAVVDELRTGRSPATGLFHRLAVQHRVGVSDSNPMVPCAVPMSAAR